MLWGKNNYVTNNITPVKYKEVKVRHGVTEFVLTPVTDLAHYLRFHFVSSGKNTFWPCDQREKHSQFPFERQKGPAALWVIIFTVTSYKLLL